MKLTLKDDDEEGGEGDENAEPSSPSCSDYLIHYLSLFWKVLFAFVPPTG
jgi:solute carrier family 8 (sodium/calcium exchanger)